MNPATMNLPRLGGDARREVTLYLSGLLNDPAGAYRRAARLRAEGYALDARLGGRRAGKPLNWEALLELLEAEFHRAEGRLIDLIVAVSEQDCGGDDWPPVGFLIDGRIYVVGPDCTGSYGHHGKILFCVDRVAEFAAA